MPKPLATPVLLKDAETLRWPVQENAFYVLASNGLFLCRNHPFFRSCVPASQWPSELFPHEPELRLRYPRIPQPLFEQIVGFFDEVGERYGAEAAVLLAWNPAGQCIEPVVPEQTATVGSSMSGRPYPIGLSYDAPADLPAGWMVLGDAHSHVDGDAYASATDKDDETHRAGLHIVVGRLYREPPQLHIEVVVDRMRFRVASDQVLEGYTRRSAEFPPEWMERVKVAPPSGFTQPSDAPPTGYERNGHRQTFNRLQWRGDLDA